MSRQGTRASLKWRFIGAWQWKRFYEVAGFQFALALALMFALAAVSENDMARIAAVDPELMTAYPGYSVQVDGTMRGVDVRWLRNALPVQTRYAARSVEIAEGNLIDAARGLRYTLSFERESGAVLLSKDLGGVAPVLLWVWLGFGAVQLLSWLGGFGEAARKAGRLLTPLTELGEGLPPPPPALPPAQTLHGSDRKAGELAEVIRNINVGRLDTRIDVESCHQELRGLAAAINAMLERIDEAYRLQARFVSDASHELRTPISVIQGYASLLDRWGKEDPATLQEAIDAIKSEAEHMRALVEQLLFLARGGSDKLELTFADVDAAALLREVCKEAQLVDPGHAWSVASDDTVLVRADSSFLKQTLRILTDNAMKYTPMDGEISLRAYRREGFARLEVQDSGVGIAPEELPRVFDRFFRADASRDKRTGGAGLGLSIAKWIVEKHGGHFEIVSRPALGTRVTVCLPCVEDREE